MQDREIPPEEEGETDGGAVDVHQAAIAVADKDAIVRTRAVEFTAHRWTTTIAPRLAATMDTNNTGA
jgi:hypothetical protein